MGVNTQVWAAEAKEGLYPDNSIVQQSINDDQYATAEKVIVPIAGTDPDVLFDNTTYPLSPVPRVDSVVEYPTIKVETKPTVIVGLEGISLSYDKRQSVLSQHVNALNKKTAGKVIQLWSPKGTVADRVIRTTGDARSPILSGKGAVGQRKLIALDDILNAQGLLDDLDVPEDGRICFLPSRMKNDLLKIADIRKKESFGIEVLPSGVVTQIAGFRIMYRSSAGMYDNSGRPVPVDRFDANTVWGDANAAALFFHPMMVRKGFYNVQVNIGQPDPVYSGGQTFNTISKIGASPAYTDFRGIVALVEDHV